MRWNGIVERFDADGFAVLHTGCVDEWTLEVLASRITPLSPAGAAALDGLRARVSSDRYQRRIELTTGDVIWLDNRRVMHGRTRLSGRYHRSLRRLRLLRGGA